MKDPENQWKSKYNEKVFQKWTKLSQNIASTKNAWFVDVN